MRSYDDFVELNTSGMFALGQTEAAVAAQTKPFMQNDVGKIVCGVCVPAPACSTCISEK